MPLILFLTGCYQEVHTWNCESEAYEVDDDELAGDLEVSAGDVLQTIGGPSAFDARDERGEPVSGEVHVVRAAGPAIVVDASMVQGVARGDVGFGQIHTSGRPVCEDSLEVPVALALVTDDGAIDVSVMDFAVARSTEPRRISVDGELAPADLDDTAESAGVAVEWAAGALDQLILWRRVAGQLESVLETE